MSLFDIKNCNLDGLVRIFGAEINPPAVVSRCFHNFIFRHFDQHQSGLYDIPRAVFRFVTTVAQPRNGSEPVVDSDVVRRFVRTPNSCAFCHNTSGYGAHGNLNVVGKQREITQ